MVEGALAEKGKTMLTTLRLMSIFAIAGTASGAYALESTDYRLESTDWEASKTPPSTPWNMPEPTSRSPG